MFRPQVHWQLFDPAVMVVVSDGKINVRVGLGY
jgi:hypothetical protein